VLWDHVVGLGFGGLGLGRRIPRSRKENPATLCGKGERGGGRGGGESGAGEKEQRDKRV